MYIHTLAVPLCGVLLYMCILLKQAEILWIIWASVSAMTSAQSFTDLCQRLQDSVSNSHNYLVLSWILSTSTKSTPSPDRLLSFDTFWLATHTVSGAGLVISLMLGFRSIASIFSYIIVLRVRAFWLDRLRHVRHGGTHNGDCRRHVMVAPFKARTI